MPLSQGGARLDKLLGQVHDLLPDPTLPDGVGVVVGPTKPATRHTLAQPRASLPSPSLSVLSEFKGLTRLRRGTHEHSRAPHCRRPRSRFSHSHALQAYNAPAVPKTGNATAHARQLHWLLPLPLSSRTAPSLLSLVPTSTVARTPHVPFRLRPGILSSP